MELLWLFLIFSAENTPGDHVCARVVILTAHLTAIVILTSFSASLIASIVNDKYYLPFRNFQEFLDDGTYELEVLANSAELDYFKVNKISHICISLFVL